jgi:hypothetical protein
MENSDEFLSLVELCLISSDEAALRQLPASSVPLECLIHELSVKILEGDFVGMLEHEQMQSTLRSCLERIGKKEHQLKEATTSPSDSWLDLMEETNSQEKETISPQEQMLQLLPAIALLHLFSQYNITGPWPKKPLDLSRVRITPIRNQFGGRRERSNLGTHSNFYLSHTAMRYQCQQ